MRILMVGSEAEPHAKTGGLGDVLGALPRALGRLGHEVDVVMPRYRGITAGSRLESLRVVIGGVASDVPLYGTRSAGGVRVMFVDHPGYFDRDFLYGPASGDYSDNAARFGFLSHAALALAARESYAVIHAHDWQAGLLPVLLAQERTRRAHTAPPAVLTIHNLAYQGVFDSAWLSKIGLGADMMHTDAMEYWGRISFLKGGIRFARLLTTVSPRYAEEVQTPEFGCGFEGLLRQRSRDLIGILNGIDYDQWDPQRDVHLPEPFSASNLTGKRAAKRQVLAALGLTSAPATLERPLIGVVSRLVAQKGFDLVAAAADNLTVLGATFAVLGSGDRNYEDLWRSLAARYPDQIGARIGFDEGLAHLIEGGADMFLMPSRFEPCGLNQMYSLRYGTVPVVRAVGGLFDTVRNYDERTGEGTGFTFQEYSAKALLETLGRAIATYARKNDWARIQRSGMREDHSWDAAARQYVAVYERAVDSGQ